MAPVVHQQQQELQLLRQFDQNGDHLAIVTAGVDAHRLRVFDTHTGQIKCDFHDAQTVPKFNCMSWVQVQMSGSDADAVAPSRKSGKQRKTAPALMPMIALGSQNNEVHLYSINHGQIVRTLASGKNSNKGAAVVDFVVNSDGTVGYSATSDGWVTQWQMNSGEISSSWKADEKLSRVSLSADEGILVTVDHQIKYWDLSQCGSTKSKLQQPKHLASGHATKITDLCFQPSATDARLWTAAEQDRFISGWSSTLPTAISTLSSESNIMQINFSLDGKYLLGTTEDGRINIWDRPELKPESDNNSKKNKKKHRSRKPDCIVSVVSSADEKQLIAISSAKFIAENQVLIARGDLLPRFERISIMKSDSEKLLSKIVIKRDPNVGLLTEKEQQKSAAELKRQNYDERQATILSQSEFAIAKPTMDEDEDDENVPPEATIGEKLKALQMESEKVSTAAAGGKRAQPPKADSLQQMLVQALHSTDHHLLEECLEVSDTRIISNTIQRLPIQYVIPFLQQIVHRFQTRPTRGKILARWIKMTLLHHMGYLMSNPQLLSNLAPLYQTVDARLGNFQKLLRLQGRLDVLDQQIRMRRALQEELELNQNSSLDVPAVVYDENEEWAEEEDDEDEDEDQDESDEEMMSGADDKLSYDEDDDAELQSMDEEEV